MRSTVTVGALLVAAFLVAGCSETPVSPPQCIDEDGDGVDSCSDCNDKDPAVYPGAPEKCDGKDNNCNGVIDEGCAVDGGPTDGGPADGGPGDGGPVDGGNCGQGDRRPCGVVGSTCQEACQPNGTWGACQPQSGPTDFQTDVNNCGTCGRVCPTPVNAERRCVAGQCGRGPCAAGKFDFDRNTTFGCEASCTGRTCTDGSGNPVTASSDPLPETGVVFQSLASGSSWGGSVQTNGSFTNMGALGEPTPPGVGGAIESSSSSYRNQGGFGAIDRK